MKNSSAAISRSPPGPRSDERAPQRQQRRGQVGGGVAVGDRAADGAAVADLRVADLPGHLGQQRHLLPHQVGGGHVVVAGQRPDAHGAAAVLRT